VRVNPEDVGARRRLAPTGSTLRVKPDAAFGGHGHAPRPVWPVVTGGLGSGASLLLNLFDSSPIPSTTTACVNRKRALAVLGLSLTEEVLSALELAATTPLWIKLTG